MDTRPSKDNTFLSMAIRLSEQTTCRRRAVGCILVNKHNHIIGSGYNGVAAGLPHCLDIPCGGQDYASGEGLDVCEAIHAEQNALMQCSNIHEIVKAYVTTEPCMHCTKMLLNTSCKEIYFLNDYDAGGKTLWFNANRKWIGILKG